ncbi:hypothetical protein [Gaoshiqia sediminis]|uniref:Gliding motility lipoprotein GldB n=1 Tax=Gaoshiqia sediminis TaxID=2986998 RepID=A0AA42C6Q9_9BACT|nr:hypothetical protein [Gaoshiqia sediminis]MCW0484188.1 hypothetical protein [Gaoshiqia sediminis]
MNRVIWAFVLATLLFSCHQDPLKVDVSDIDVHLQLKSLDDALFGARDRLPEELSSIEAEFANLLPLFTYQMIRIGGPENPDYTAHLQSFLDDSLLLELKEKVDQTFHKERLERELTDAFRHYRYYFPERLIPEVYTCVSGFNQSLVLTDSLIGISLDKYIGTDCEYYTQLGLPRYKIRNMHPEKVVPDVMYAWGLSEWPFEEIAPHLIDRMIYEGKLLYFVDAMLPDVADTLKIGFTNKQLEFCRAREDAMWTYLAENKLLFSTERMDVKRYIDDAPYTSSFTADSPGRTGAWLGWQIVRSYMKKNPETTLKELMAETHYQGILNRSGYQPGRSGK